MQQCYDFPGTGSVDGIAWVSLLGCVSGLAMQLEVIPFPQTSTPVKLHAGILIFLASKNLV